MNGKIVQKMLGVFCLTTGMFSLWAGATEAFYDSLPLSDDELILFGMGLSIFGIMLLAYQFFTRKKTVNHK